MRVWQVSEPSFSLAQLAQDSVVLAEVPAWARLLDRHSSVGCVRRPTRAAGERARLPPAAASASSGWRAARAAHELR
jgi:hypothetical protein